MKTILYKIRSLSFYLINVFTFNPEAAIRYAIDTLRSVSYLYLGWLSFSYIDTDLDYILKDNPVQFVDFKITDHIWFISTKTLAFSFYFAMYLLIRHLPPILEKAKVEINERKFFVFSIELFVITIFAFVDLIWQITEMINYWWANNVWFQGILSFLTVGAFTFLFVSRTIIKLCFKEINEDKLFE